MQEIIVEDKKFESIPTESGRTEAGKEKDEND